MKLQKEIVFLIANVFNVVKSGVRRADEKQMRHTNRSRFKKEHLFVMTSLLYTPRGAKV